MKITEEPRKYSSCNFCNSGELDKNGNGLVYPYNYTYSATRDATGGLVVNFCPACAKEFAAFIMKTK